MRFSAVKMYVFGPQLEDEKKVAYVLKISARPCSNLEKISISEKSRKLLIADERQFHQHRIFSMLTKDPFGYQNT